MRCAYLAQDRLDNISTHDTFKTSCEVLERSAEKSMAVLRARSKRSSLGRARGQRWSWRHSNASKHVWSERAERSTFAQTQFNSSKRDWQCGKRVLRTRERRMLKTVSAKPVCRLELEATTFTAQRLFKREGSCIAKEEELTKRTRHIQTRMLWLQERVAAKHLRVVK